MIRFPLWHVAAVILHILVSARTAGSQELTPSSCDRLLAAAAPVGDHGSAMSQEARRYLSLIDLALAHLGPELPVFLKNLKQLGESEGPVNPYVNLESILGRALLKQAEPLLLALDPSWPEIRSEVLKRTQAVAEEQTRRTHDVHSTREVITPVEIPNSFSPDPKNRETLYFIGETSDALYLGSRAIGGMVSQLSRMIFRLSKMDQVLQLIDAYSVPYVSFDTQEWMHNGMIYGFAERIEDVVEPSSEPWIYRLNPETGQKDWAEPWTTVPKGTQGHRMIHRIEYPNSIVGIEVKNPRFAVGEVYRFDFDQFKFVPTGLTFDETTLPFYSKPKYKALKDYLKANVAYHGGQQAMQIGRFFKTDGQSLVQISDSANWVHWSANESMTYLSGWCSSGETGKSRLQEAQARYSKNMIVHTIPTGREAIPIGIQCRISERHFASADSGRSIVFMAENNEDQPIQLFLVDRQSWTATPVETVGGPSKNSHGSWDLIRNQADDLLLRFDAKEQVALWKFEPSTRRFELKLHEFLEGADSVVKSEALLDYDKFRIVAWSYTDSAEQQGLRVWLRVDLSRGDGE